MPITSVLEDCSPPVRMAKSKNNGKTGADKMQGSRTSQTLLAGMQNGPTSLENPLGPSHQSHCTLARRPSGPAHS